MSEKEEWKKWRTNQDSKFEKLKKAVDQLTKVDSPGEASAHPVHTIEDLVNCPDCYPKIKSAVITKEFKDADFKCEKCGLPVKGEESKKEDWNCPGCEHGFAKPKE